MRNNITTIQSLAYTLLACMLHASSAISETKRPVLVKPMKPAEEREDYQQCLTTVIKKYQTLPGQKINPDLQNGLATCRDRYPAVSILVDCKKEMAAAYKDDPEGLKLALLECKNEYMRFTFNTKNPVPFVLKSDQVYFAGAGLNQGNLLRAKETDSTGRGLYMDKNFGNFSCENLYRATFRKQNPEYLLFGNDPFLYTPLRHADRDSFLKAMGFALGPDQTKPKLQAFHKDFGELRYEPKLKRTTNFFPLSYCSFDRQLGELYEGIKIYYLVDRGSAFVTPYFGVAFYQPSSKVSVQTLAEQIRSSLGGRYQIYKIRSGIQYVSQVKPTLFDDEGDPKNVCGSDMTSPYIAIINERGQTGQAEYSLLANISNLCRYGDKIASRFLKKGL